MAITASFLRRTIDHGVDGGGGRFGSGHTPLAPAIRGRKIGGAGSGAVVEAVATKDALLAAWIGIPARIFLRRFRFIPV